VLIQTEVVQTRRVAREVAQMQGIASAVPVAGSYEVIAIVEAASMDTLQDGLPYPRREGRHPHADLYGRAHMR